MAEYFAGGHLRFVNGEWRDDNGDAIEISHVRHGRWIEKQEKIHLLAICIAISVVSVYESCIEKSLTALAAAQRWTWSDNDY